MRLVEVLPMIVLQRPFDAHNVSSDNFHFYSTIRSTEAVAEMNMLTRHHLRQDEFLMMTVMGGTYLEHGTSPDQLEPLAFFHSAFGCGDETTGADALADTLVNMTKQELSRELRGMIYGQSPFWRPKYSGLKILLCRKTAVLPDYLSSNTPVLRLPEADSSMSKIIAYREKAMAMMA